MPGDDGATSGPVVSAEPPWPALPAVVERATAAVFRWVARARHERGLHPRGALLYGTADLSTLGTMLAGRADPKVVVRLSRRIGLPDPFPDFNGVAVRFVDAHGVGRHQDLLLTSAPGLPVLRQAIRPCRTFGASGFSSVLRYRDRTGRSLIFRIAPLLVDRLEDLGPALPVTLELSAASPFGRWRPLASLHLARLEQDTEVIRFDPWNTGWALEPTGLLNRLRGPAYAGSRAGRAR